VAAEKLVHECNTLLRKEIIHLNKFSTLMRLLCSGKRLLPGPTSVESKNQHPDLVL
jgi:hypothetical protein